MMRNKIKFISVCLITTLVFDSFYCATFAEETEVVCEIEEDVEYIDEVENDEEIDNRESALEISGDTEIIEEDEQKADEFTNSDNENDFESERYYEKQSESKGYDGFEECIESADEYEIFRVKYDQTEARKMFQMIKDFRNSGAGYWDDSNSFIIYTNPDELPEMHYSYHLEAIAMLRAAELAKNFSHYRPNGKTPTSVYSLEGFKYGTAGENIYKASGSGFKNTAQNVFNTLREDDKKYPRQGHRQNMLDKSYSLVGVACCEYDNEYFWVQELARPGDWTNPYDTSYSSKIDERVWDDYADVRIYTKGDGFYITPVVTPTATPTPKPTATPTPKPTATPTPKPTATPTPKPTATPTPTPKPTAMPTPTPKQVKIVEEIPVEVGDTEENVAKNVYSIEYVGNGATSGEMDIQECKINKKYNLEPNSYKRKGYTFNGWNTKKNGKGKTYKNKASIKNLANEDGKTVKLYASWKANKYTVKFNKNGGEGSINKISVTYGKNKTLPKNTLTRKGYKFKGWATSKANAKKGKVKYKNKAKIKNLTAKNKGSVTLYAVWKKK